MAEPFVSYARNAEDVVLWRALRHVDAGTYVDVGAAGPEEGSATAALYERGWRGLNLVTSMAVADSLARARPGDVTVEMSPYTSLDEVLDSAGLSERDIHLCRLDDRLSQTAMPTMFERMGRRPWVLVVALDPTTPSASREPALEHRILAAGYRFVLFDGLNRFYVSPGHLDLATALGSPVSVFDEPWEQFDRHRRRLALENQADRAEAEAEQLDAAAAAARAQAEELEQRAAYVLEKLQPLASGALAWRAQVLYAPTWSAHLRDRANAVAAEIEATRRTISWRVTWPLRLALTASRHLPVRRSQAEQELGGAPSSSGLHSYRPATMHRADMTWGPHEAAFADRLSTVAGVLAEVDVEPGPSDLAAASARFEAALEETGLPAPTVAWLTWVAVRAAYPTCGELEDLTRLIQLDGPAALGEWALVDLADRVRDGAASDRRLRVENGAVLVDVTHTAAYDFQTGIQRVAREVAERWQARHGALLCGWDLRERILALLGPTEVERFVAWRARPSTDPPHDRRTIVGAADALVVPWRATLVVPELAAEPERSDLCRALARAGVLERLSFIAYDLIPVTIGETVAEGMGGAFSGFLSTVKHGQRVSGISRTTCDGFDAFSAMVDAQGLQGPQVAAHVLPTESPPLSEVAIETARSALELDDTPLVLVVGSHEPRKNHVTVLVAAEQLWREGKFFQLLFIGARGWRGDRFDDVVRQLVEIGRPVHVVKAADEATLWGAYRLARFTVFPSLSEGFGLPVAESLASGTPVITSAFGSMAEVATDGGALTIDPRDPDTLAAAMASLLDDDELVAELGRQALARPSRSWDRYSDETWAHLVD